jgi:hypothetical protein
MQEFSAEKFHDAPKEPRSNAPGAPAPTPISFDFPDIRPP